MHASGCAPLLLYVLLYRTDAHLPGELDRTLTDFALSTGIGLFVPKPTRDAMYHRTVEPPRTRTQLIAHSASKQTILMVLSHTGFPDTMLPRGRLWSDEHASC